MIAAGSSKEVAGAQASVDVGVGVGAVVGSSQEVAGALVGVGVGVCRVVQGSGWCSGECRCRCWCRCCSWVVQGTLFVATGPPPKHNKWTLKKVSICCAKVDAKMDLFTEKRSSASPKKTKMGPFMESRSRTQSTTNGHF